MTKLPSYDELPTLDGLGLPHAWDVWDPDLGTVGLCTPEAVAAAAPLVRTGEVFTLNLPLDEPDPPLFGRAPYHHEIFATDRNHVDDRIDGFSPQASSQWDGLRHVRARQHGFFGGRPGGPDGFAPGAGDLGIEHWARRGIVGRGVLLDVARYRAASGRPLDPLAGEVIEPDDLAATVAGQEITLRPGDILCVRTGWIEAFRALDGPARQAASAHPRISGLNGSEAMARLLWDAHPAALAADNPTVEVAPGDPAVGSLHRRLLPTLGFALGELFDLAGLASACAADGRWEFFFVAAPLNLPGGVASPANALGIR
ncbi:MAG: cyclase family protein [Acidimicrobiia bacterium]